MSRKPLPTDREILDAIYERYYDTFANYSETAPTRSSKIYVPIDISEIAARLGVDGDIVFGRLYYYLEKKHGYQQQSGASVPLFALEAGGDRHCINFPYMASVLAAMRAHDQHQSESDTMASGNCLDPFRTVLGVINSSDTLTTVATAAGLRFDMRMTEREGYSHGTRVRALLPRVVAAYDALSPQDQLIATKAVVSALVRSTADAAANAIDALATIGWELRGEDLVTASDQVRERFFPKGSPWDAAVVIRGFFEEAKAELLINDSYCDGSVFPLLASRKDLKQLKVRVLCSKYAANVAAEAKVFIRQYPGVTVEIRTVRGDFHDRFILIDGISCVHLGASIKDAGNTGFMLSRVEDPANRARLISEMQASWSSGMVVPY
jgi:hypothetical protein